MAGESPAERDRALMRRALANAERGWGQTAPNPMVGAVVVSGDEVIADGWHARFGASHAEVDALSKAGDRARGSTMYTTLEPCTHHAKTPPCAYAVIAAGVRRVVIATRDPNPIAMGGVEHLESAGIEVVVGVEAAAALELNAPFFNAFVSDRPWVILKLALSADGAIADPTGQRRWISGPESRAYGHRMRAGVDAIAVGIGTVLADDPELTVRDAPAPRCQPVRVIFDSRLRMPIDSAIVDSAARISTIIIATRPEASRLKPLHERGIEVIPADSLADGLRQLRRKGVQSLLVEGGAKLAGSLIREDLVDRLALFEAPLVLGSDAPQAFEHSPTEFAARLRTLPVVKHAEIGEDTFTLFAVRNLVLGPQEKP
jgi:diaminohydroxyphosphoribosylaminopyrimidine deaminase/5-amino-6-(5-phosphoribosylamino)uracil reductase